MTIENDSAFPAVSLIVVEIDLLRSGKPMSLVKGEVKSDYRILVSRSDTRPSTDMYAFNFTKSNPFVSVPLGRGDTGTR